MLPDTQDWKQDIYRNKSPLPSHKKSILCKLQAIFTASHCGQITISIWYPAKLTTLDLWVSVLCSFLTLCSALLLVHMSFGYYFLSSLSVSPLLCRKSWFWHFTHRLLLRVSTYGSVGWRTRPFISASTNTNVLYVFVWFFFFFYLKMKVNKKCFLNDKNRRDWKWTKVKNKQNFNIVTGHPTSCGKYVI